LTADGLLDKTEFCIANYLIDHVVEKGQELPAVLPGLLHPDEFKRYLP
jgi:hypothetical protein